jgi:hypothetical protein
MIFEGNFKGLMAFPGRHEIDWRPAVETAMFPLGRLQADLYLVRVGSIA